ncbi:MAG TPA: hypothetical protein VL283_01175 [Candidatus Baltobacteraceae bacterium]|nr:hypothetical protein [Candidatus Baltobacteraceae bacterium]
MSDDKKAGGDKAAEQANAPITPDQVKVTVKPRQDNLPKRGDPARAPTERQNESNKELADKAADGAAKEVREAVTKAAPKGREAQKDAVRKAAEDVGAKLPQRAIKEIEVKIEGEKTPISAPATEGPPPDPPPPKKGI